jgi:outer membrane lipase/esterase
MSCNWKRRILLALASASALLVAACGSGTIESQLQPSRIVAFGDAMSDLGQVNGRRYTVNDGSVNIWSHQVAARFGVAASAANSGGTFYATGNARVTSKPDAAGSSVTLTVKEQIDAFLAGNAIGANDLLIVNAGTSDIVAEMAAVTAGTQTGDQMLANVGQAGRDQATQARRLVQAGAKHVVVVGPYNLGRAPLAAFLGQGALLTQASTRFNEELLVALVDLGANVLYVDAALLFNLMVANPGSYDFGNVTDPVCLTASAVDCDTSTVGIAEYNRHLFADRIYPTPQGHRKFGDYAFDKIRERW